MRITILLLIILNFSCYAQNENQFEYDNFENQFSSYEPVQNPNVSAEDFNYGLMIIKQTKSVTKNDPKNFVITDYFNILSAFLTLKESEENIMVVFEKFKNSENSAKYFLAYENDVYKNPKYDIIREDYNKELSKCKAKTEFNLSEYCKINNLDSTLVRIIYNISSNDQKYRGKKSNELLIAHKELDNQNQTIIDSLYIIHRTYIGKSLVGDKFEDVMWAVVQHSNPVMMERYLPVVHEAVRKKELKPVPLKMLIDRFYGLRYGYQIFGSQSGFGFKLANAKTRKEIETKYGLK